MNLLSKLILSVLLCILLTDICRGKQSSSTPARLPDEVIRQLELAEQGSPTAQEYMGYLYQTGTEIPKDEGKAVKWCRKAADQGHAIAQYDLGMMYLNGAGVPKDEIEAVKWFRKAADQGHATAQFNLGMLYLNGVGVPKDELEAAKWFRKAADQGHDDAQKALIQMQTAREEAKRVQNEAKRVQKEAERVQKEAERVQKEAERVQTIYTNALHGNADAQLQLGLMCQSRWDSVKYQVDAAKWYRKAADQGNATAQYNLGVMYRTGAGVPKDELEAAKWLSKAADQGNAEAQVNIGSLYLHGQGVPKDESEAVRWYRRAADQGNSDAQRALLQIQTVHDESERVQKEVERVQTIYTNALQGNADAQFTLGSMYQQGEGITKDPTEGMKWYRKAAEQGHVGALNNIGVACERGVCAVQDNVEACSYYLTASSFGDDENSRKNAKIWRNQLSAEEYAEAQRRAHLRVEAIRKRATSANTSKGGSSTTQDGEPQLIGYGTGFIICQDGYLLTCNHVVQDSKSIKVQVGDTKYPATIARRDVANDLALLKIKGSVFATVPLQTDVPSKGSKVFTVGYPNPELQGMEPKYTDGTISSLSGIQDDIRTLQISVPVQSGNSGGALIDEDGNVIGIVVAKLNAVAAFGYTGDLPQNVNYAIKIMYAMPLIQSVEGLKQRIPLLGKSLKPTNATSTAEKATCMVIVYK